MTLKEFFENNQLLAIHLKTKEQADVFSKEADKLGKKWGSENSYLEFNYWDEYQEKTCYDNENEYQEFSYYHEIEKCKILKFEDIEWEELKMSDFTKKDIKNGAVVELRNGKRFLKLDNTLLGLYNNVLKENYTPYLLLDYYEENLRYKTDSNYDIMKVLNPDNNFFVKDYNSASALLALNFINFSWTWERKEKRKIKLKDLTLEQYKKWCKDNCSNTKCEECVFFNVTCGIPCNGCWVKHKDLYSEKFLNQEIEIEEKK